METLLEVFWIREFGGKICGIFRSDKVGNPLNFAIGPLDNLGQKLTGCGQCGLKITFLVCIFPHICQVLALSENIRYPYVIAFRGI